MTRTEGGVEVTLVLGAYDGHIFCVANIRYAAGRFLLPTSVCYTKRIEYKASPPPSDVYAPNVTNTITVVEGVASFSLFPEHE